MMRARGPVRASGVPMPVVVEGMRAFQTYLDALGMDASVEFTLREPAEGAEPTLTVEVGPMTAFCLLGMLMEHVMSGRAQAAATILQKEPPGEVM